MVVPSSPKPASDYAKEWWNGRSINVPNNTVPLPQCVICGGNALHVRTSYDFNSFTKAEATHVIARIPTDCEYGKKGEFVWTHYWNCWKPYEKSLEKTKVVEYVLRITVENVLDDDYAIGYGKSAFILSSGSIVESRVIETKENNNK